MARGFWIMLCVGIGGCAWVTNQEYLDAWDGDSDGFSLENDCGRTDPDIFPGAPDFRGDGCDADCGVSRDSDGDDWPDDADCNPTDPGIFPCNPTDSPDDGRDSDCDGKDTARATLDCPTADPSHPDVEPMQFDATCENPSVASGS